MYIVKGLFNTHLYSFEISHENSIVMGFVSRLYNLLYLVPQILDLSSCSISHQPSHRRVLWPYGQMCKTHSLLSRQELHMDYRCQHFIYEGHHKNIYDLQVAWDVLLCTVGQNMGGGEGLFRRTICKPHPWKLFIVYF